MTDQEPNARLPRPKLSGMSFDFKAHDMTAVTNVDPLNFAVCKLQLLKDDIPLAVATGFFYRVTVNDAPTTYLVTNWQLLALTQNLGGET
jgi:hypothetical protein